MSPNFNILELHNLVNIYLLILIHCFTLQSYPFSYKQIICNYKLLTTIQRKAMRIKLGELKLIYRFNIIPTKIPGGHFLAETDRLILKFTRKLKGP